MSGAVMIAAMLCGASASLAQTPVPDLNTTQGIYEQCKSEDPVDEISCLRYLTGVANMMELLGVVTQQPSVNRAALSQAGIFKASICYANYNGTKLRQIFINWAETNPTQWERPSLGGAVAAFQEAWPCQ